MTPLREVELGALPPERFRSILGERYDEVARALVQAQTLFDGRVIWHVNSTARGGGVAELLSSLLAYARGAGVDGRWMVIEGNPEFFRVTKRIHNHLHGVAGDGGALGDEERRIYEDALEQAGVELQGIVRPRDIVYLHDPQTAGLVAPLRETGAAVVWRCHVGLDLPTEIAHGAWDFLRPHVAAADAFVFSRREFVWDGLDPERIWIVPPSIDAFSPKNQDLAPDVVRAIMARSGLLGEDPATSPSFTREDGSPGRVDRHAEVDEDAPIPPEAPLVTQVSRWDRLKDPVGVLDGFARGPDDAGEAHLLLAGPASAAVADDPEGAEVLAEVRAAREALQPAIRERVHLACLPMDDTQENAAMVNAIQRHSDVIVQKSLAEGFGLTVAEAMWKRRAVIASGRGGILDQIVDGESGVLLADPADLDAFGHALAELLADRSRRERLGAAARARIEDRFLGTRHLIQYLALLDGLLESRQRTGASDPERG